MNQIEPKKNAGRPKGALNKPKTTELKEPAKKGRPFTYKPVEGISNAKLTYQRRGFLINKIVCFKRTYGLTEPTRDQYVGKSNDEVIELLKNMAIVVGKLKEAQIHEQIAQDYTTRSKNVEHI